MVLVFFGTVIRDCEEKLSDSSFIFDIDGTLVNLRTVWENTYNSLYQQQFSFSLTDTEMQGMFGPPELECHSIILRGRRLYTPNRAEELVALTEKSMLDTLQRASPLLLPAVPKCLEYLARAEVPLAVATGNIPTIARAILDASHLSAYFQYISCSDPSTPTRADIVRNAHQRLPSRSNTYVVGDTPSDIKAAKTVGLISVAVATGNYTLQELAQHQPDILLEDLTTFREAIDVYQLRQ